MVLYSTAIILSLLAATANKEGRDVTTLAAAVGPRVHFSAREALALGDLRVPPQDCAVLEDGQLDCTEALKLVLNRQSGYETVVLLKPLVVAGEGVTCSLIELRTLARRAVWENGLFEGIGFYADGVVTFIEKSQALVQKDAFLLSNNEPVLIHSFIDVGLCEGVTDHYDFKAFVQFDGPTRVWENQPVNYRLQRGQRGFDRTLDLIRP